MAISHDTAAQLSHELVRLMKLFQSLRQHAPRLHPGVDTASYPILFNLHDGPRRVSDLAGRVHSDVSTVSRQVTGLVTHGLVEKVPDPQDGRAQVLSLTSAGTDPAGAAEGPAGCVVPQRPGRLERGRGQGLHRLPRAPHVRLRAVARAAAADGRGHRTDGARPRPHLIRFPRQGAVMASTAGAPLPSPVQDDGALTHKQIVTILIGLMMGMFLAALDQTIVASAMRVIADDLKDLAGQAWVTTAYLITSTIVTPLYGKLSDIYGRKKWFVTAITIFVLGSVLVLVRHLDPDAGRVPRGPGPRRRRPVLCWRSPSSADIVPPRERAKYQGYFLAVFGTSSVLGPVIGGFFAGQETLLGIAGWRWVFLVNVPIGIAALVVVSRTLHLGTPDWTTGSTGGAPRR